MRLSHDIRQNIAKFNLLAILSGSVSFMSQLVRNSVLFISQICRVPKRLRLNCERSATSSRQVRDTRDDFTTILSHKTFEHVKILATTLRHLVTHVRKLRITGNCLETALRPTRDVCRQLSQNSRSPVR